LADVAARAGFNVQGPPSACRAFDCEPLRPAVYLGAAPPSFRSCLQASKVGATAQDAVE
jgi:hypothetical protein